jgi:hypothetical protein
MNLDELQQRLTEGHIVALDESEWLAVAPQLCVVETHDTMMRGHLVIVDTSSGLVAVEEPEPKKRVLRLLGDRQAASVFVSERLATYERMWDGCGCRIDYYS